MFSIRNKDKQCFCRNQPSKLAFKDPLNKLMELIFEKDNLINYQNQ